MKILLPHQSIPAISNLRPDPTTGSSRLRKETRAKSWYFLSLFAVRSVIDNLIRAWNAGDQGKDPRILVVSEIGISVDVPHWVPL
jgi:hypothetical protein